MISRSGNKNFLAAHYEWFAVAVGVIVLAVGAALYVMSLGEDAEEAAANAASSVQRMKSSGGGVEPVDMTAYRGATRLTKNPAAVSVVSDKTENFLASERRVLCTCGKAISGDVVACPKCPFCGKPQEVEKKQALDADGDGLPDEWERKYGFNPNSAADANEDADGDGFTNAEEFQAKTDPRDKNDHPDYLDSLTIQLPLKQTVMPFAFRKANKIPSGWRCEFFDPARKDDYGRRGATLTAVVGDPIADTGFVLKKFTEKSVKRAIAGSEGLTKSVDVSEVEVERSSDKKLITLVIQSGKTPKMAAVDVQATLVYQRGGVQNFDVVPGSKISLNGTQYVVSEVKAVNKGAQVTVENVLTGKKRTLSALEP